MKTVFAYFPTVFFFCFIILCCYTNLTFITQINEVVSSDSLVYFVGINYNPVFPSGFGDFAHSMSPHSSEQQQQDHPLDHNASGKTEYMAFPKPFESSSSNGAEKQRYLMSQCNSPLIIFPPFSGACGISSFF